MIAITSACLLYAADAGSTTEAPVVTNAAAAAVSEAPAAVPPIIPTDAELAAVCERYFQLPALYGRVQQKLTDESFAQFTNVLGGIVSGQLYDEIRKDCSPKRGAYPKDVFQKLALSNCRRTGAVHTNDNDYRVLYMAERTAVYENFPFLIWDNKIQYDDIDSFMQEFAITNMSQAALSNMLAAYRPGDTLSAGFTTTVEFTVTVRASKKNIGIISVRERPVGTVLTLDRRGNRKRGVITN